MSCGLSLHSYFPSCSSHQQFPGPSTNLALFVPVVYWQVVYTAGACSTAHTISPTSSTFGLIQSAVVRVRVLIGSRGYLGHQCAQVTSTRGLGLHYAVWDTNEDCFSGDTMLTCVLYCSCDLFGGFSRSAAHYPPISTAAVTQGLIESMPNAPLPTTLITQSLDQKGDAKRSTFRRSFR